MSHADRHATAMTVEEAALIRLHARRGSLDLALPDIGDIVRDAERTCARAELWGRTPDARRRSAAGAVAIAATTVLLVGVCMLPWPGWS
ncbi:hypothetical protein [Leifsonia aquatica]|uniref:hypothetical protein n=1 Tax=Leifsonia aquatica TaxID=144185 RepID=UPI00046A57D9|nr:hypothetical protein [Leifsonia aquatica]